MDSIFFEITFIITLATILAIIFRILKQPPILAYILTGIIAGPVGIFEIRNMDVLRTLGQFGITFLLFMLGLELKISEIRSVGKSALFIGFGQIIFTFGIGFLLCLALGFSTITSVYLAIALTFSSTIIIVKLLSDKRDLNSLYGKIAVGVLLIQDFIAILALIVLSSLSNSSKVGFELLPFFLTFGKGIFVFTIVIGLSKTLLPKLFRYVAGSPEVLFLTSLAWVFGLAAIVSSPFIGFSKEIGGFAAGIALANSAQNFQIISRVRSLRDFFITIFFVILGTDMIFANMLQIWKQSLVLSLFVLIGNPLIVLILMGVLGFRRRTAFLTGLTVAQISEFSLILIFMGKNLGYVSDDIVALITLVGIITFTISTYMIMNGSRLFKMCDKYVKIFERKNKIETIGSTLDQLKDHIILIGANRMGSNILEAVSESERPFIVVDFNPGIIKKLQEKNVPVLFGDIGDPDIQEHAHLEHAKLVISTVLDYHDSVLLLEALKKKNRYAKSIVSANDSAEAKNLYKKGADYVVIPHFSGGIHISEIVEDGKLEKLEKYRKRSLTYF